MLHQDRFFDPDPRIRRIARELYEEASALPLICPHGHVDPATLAVNEPFPDPTDLLIVPDHYIQRMLYSRGVSMESLGVPPTGDVEAGAPASRADPRRAWQILAENIHLFHGTPTGAWLRYQLHEIFGVRRKLEGDTAGAIYDEIDEKLRLPEFRPRALFERFDIEVLATTDAAGDSLEDHRRIRQSDWPGRVVPTFRPDALFRIADPAWTDELETLEDASGARIRDCSDFVRALQDRRRHFRSLGGTATDHAVVEPYTERLSAEALDRLFAAALRGSVGPGEQRRFQGHMLIEMARMSTDDGMIMQLHAGALRDHNRTVFRRYGADRGGDIPVATEFSRNLRPLLNEYGNDPRFTLILFTLDESTYSRELAPLAGHYPAVRVGAPWWFHDSVEGMRRFLEWTTETAGIHNLAGFVDDSRTLCSIPARHDLARRVQADWLAEGVARHVIDEMDARRMVRSLAYDLPMEAYGLERPE